MGRGRTQDCVECSKLLLGQRGIHLPLTPRLHVSVFGPFCLVPPSPLLRGGPGGCQRRRPGVGSYQSFELCRGGGAGKQGSVAWTAEGLLCARYIGLATELDGARVRQPDFPKHNLSYIKRGTLSIARNKYALSHVAFNLNAPAFK